jgi:hypothetical protein
MLSSNGPEHLRTRFLVGVRLVVIVVALFIIVNKKRRYTLNNRIRNYEKLFVQIEILSTF